MGTKYITTKRLKWIIILFFVTISTISLRIVEGSSTLGKTIYGPKPKGTIKTIDALEVGDIIDCVDIYKQPAFDNPLIKDLKLPSINLTSINKTSKHRPLFKQPWTQFGECPKGTVPIRRSPYNNVTMHRKYSNDGRNTREYATVWQYFKRVLGGRAYFNTWAPPIMIDQEISISQIWITAGHGARLETIEAGWMVSFDRFHDKRTRLFTFWSRKNYEEGCFDDMCGFVQTDHTVLLGGALYTSVFNGNQFGFTISITKSENGDWKLEIDDIEVGYFPRQLFEELYDSADSIGFGGEIKNLKTKGRHTSTAMGSGRFSTEGFRKACYIRNIKVKDSYNYLEWSEPRLQSPIITNPRCYDLAFGPHGTDAGTEIFFGGPGYNQHCQ